MMTNSSSSFQKVKDFVYCSPSLFLSLRDSLIAMNFRLLGARGVMICAAEHWLFDILILNVQIEEWRNNLMNDADTLCCAIVAPGFDFNSHG